MWELGVTLFRKAVWPSRTFLAYIDFHSATLDSFIHRTDNNNHMDQQRDLPPNVRSVIRSYGKPNQHSPSFYEAGSHGTFRNTFLLPHSPPLQSSAANRANKAARSLLINRNTPSFLHTSPEPVRSIAPELWRDRKRTLTDTMVGAYGRMYHFTTSQISGDWNKLP